MCLLNDRNVYQVLPDGDKSVELTDNSEKKVNKLVYDFANDNKITAPYIINWNVTKLLPQKSMVT